MKRKILVVEDAFEVRIALSAALAQEGYEVEAVSSGEAGVEAFEKTKPDLALLDIRLPGIGGIEVCRIIRESSSIPVVMFSAIEEQAEKIQAFQVGADDYVVKGTGIEELLARVATHLRWTRVKAADAEFKLEDSEEESELAGTENDASAGEKGASQPARSAVPARKGPAREIRPRLPKRRVRPRRYSVELGETVLIADPDEEHRQKLSRVLKRMGYEVIEAESGRQALMTIGKYLPWLVFCEMVLPDIAGETLLEVTAKNPRTQDVAVVVISNNGSPDARFTANRHGVLDYIVKPWTEEEIKLRLDWAKQALDRKRARAAESDAA